MADAKGKKYSKCNRTACTVTGGDVRWWNKFTHAYYCGACAKKIMSFGDADGMLFIPKAACIVCNWPIKSGESQCETHKPQTKEPVS